MMRNLKDIGIRHNIRTFGAFWCISIYALCKTVWLWKNLDTRQKIFYAALGEVFGRGTNERSGTDHVTWGPMRGLEKNCTRWRRTTLRHRDYMVESAKWGQFSENYLNEKQFFVVKKTEFPHHWDILSNISI